MPGLIASIVVSLLIMEAGLWGFAKLLAGLDSTLKRGIAGLLGLGICGIFIQFLGMVPSGLKAAQFVPLSGAVLGAIALIRAKARIAPLFDHPVPAWQHLLLAIPLGLGLLSASLPSDMNDWDSLAYHLAVPKIWIAEGQMSYIPFIHQSNFPFMVDNLFLAGLQLLGESAAKGFGAMIVVFSAMCAYGIGRTLAGGTAGLWACIGWLGIPIVLWESGTAYIDAAHGAYAGVGLFFLFSWVQTPDKKNLMVLAALGLGGAVATKYTGLQVLFASGFVTLFALILQKKMRLAAPAVATLGIAAVIGLPWFVRNTVNTGNPIYPFFYEQVGSRNWDSFMATIYKNEQQSFGVGRAEKGRDVSQFGHAVLGLAYQPGRYVNPGQTAGLGSPTGALGVAVIAAGLAFLAVGKRNRVLGCTLATVGVLLILWFFLSQQSRYLTIIGFPLAIVLGVLCTQIRLGPLLKLVAGCQLVYTSYLVWMFSIEPKLPVLTGAMRPSEYQHAATGAWGRAATMLNDDMSATKVALYDEVFGYLLDKEYIWANPGHSKLIDYEAIGTGEDLVRELVRNEISHVYLSFNFQPPAEREKWLAFAGLMGAQSASYTSEEIAGMKTNREIAWKIYLAQAVKLGDLELVEAFGTSGFIFRLSPRALTIGN